MDCKKCMVLMIKISMIAVVMGDNSKNEGLQKQVIIVGGGIAGLAAARKLQNTGQYAVNVLEARRERYGGRIFTDRSSFKLARGMEVDLGTNWLNSMVKDNPLAKIVSDGELEVKSAGSVQLHFPEKGQVYTGDDANKIFTEFYKITLQAMKKAADSGKDLDLKKAIQSVLRDEETVADKTLLSSVLESHYTMSLSGHSTQLFDPKKEFGWDTGVIDGFDQIVDMRTKKGEHTFCRTKETSTTDRGEQDKKQSFGVLKTETVIFDPPLPKGWKKTIESIGIGFSNKLVLQFNKVFWPEDIGIFTLVTSNQDDMGMLQTWVNLHRYVNKPLLMGMLHDQAAVRFENMTDNEIKENAINILTKLFGEEKMKDITITIVTKSKWISDNKVLGTTSYPKVGILPEMFDSLTKPVCPYIYFAGEYTSLEHMNTAHGAYMSGIRAADQIISNYCAKEPLKGKKVETSKEKTKKEKKSEKKKENQNGDKLKDEL
ncbi:KDM1B [Mytilus coruscus]|uniref:KDM1B n=1 Tax=Mytilus coruscus TaxID=42192 RepID=A0A6J8C0E7_MYTCO|nr:KDM1B [Mytilus coruscus]